MSVECRLWERLSQDENVTPNSPKSEWADDLPSGPSMRDELARLVDADGGRDPAENDYFEVANDPQFVERETVHDGSGANSDGGSGTFSPGRGASPTGSSDTIRSCRCVDAQRPTVPRAASG